MHLLLSILIIMIAYGFGSISSAVITCKLLHLPDPRSQGSGNPGATNVLRIGGKKAALLTLLGDTLKGAVPVLIAKSLGFNPFILSLVAFAALIGHLYPVFFAFKGGKGVATAFGCLISLSWPVGLALLASWVIIYILFRISSLAALITAICAPFYAWYFTNPIYVILVCVMSVLLIYRHHSNIKKLFGGKEHRLR